MGPAEIPGFYYDEEKKRYFKIERTRTAPENAKWSAENVKRRRIEETEKQKERVLEAKRRRVKLRPTQSVGPRSLGKALLDREFGELMRGVGGGEGVGVRCWVEGLKDKGEVRLVEGARADVVDDFWVGEIGGNPEEGRMAAVVGVVQEDRVWASWVPTDEQDTINFGDAARKYGGLRLRPWELPFLPQVSSLAYHVPSGRMFLASRSPRWRPIVRTVSSIVTCGGNVSDQLLYPEEMYKKGWINTCATAPASSDLACVFGSSEGILQVRQRDDGVLSWLTPKPTGPLKKGSLRPASRAARDEIFSLDFLSSNPASVLLVGGRFRHMCILDVRVPESEWVSLLHTSSIAHVKAIGTHQILAAGPKSAMAIYDVRFMDGGGKGKSWQQFGRRPLVDFPDYKNQAHIDIGLDVLQEPGYGAGIVAVAHDDGRVALYSLSDGSKLKSPVVDEIRYSGDSSTHQRHQQPHVVKALRFSNLPGDRHPSLFVGGRGVVKKYSFGRGWKDVVDW